MAWGVRSGVLAVALLMAATAAACTSETATPSPSVEPPPVAKPPARPVDDRCDAFQRGEHYPADAASEARVGATLPNVRLEGLRADGHAGSVDAAEYYEPCANTSRILVLRVNAGLWCGTCLWHASHTESMLSFTEGSRISLVDVVVTDADNHPATTAVAPTFRSLRDQKDGIPTLVDPSFSLRTLIPKGGGPSPLYVLVDRRTMRVLKSVANPDPVAFRNEFRATLAEIDGSTAPAFEEGTLVDGHFRQNEWDMLQAVTLPGAPNADPTNHVADDPVAAAWGKELFSDASLSPSGTISCATCHDPAKHFGDGRARAEGLSEGTRRTPNIALASHARWQFWDGRTDTLWAQALGPLENPVEHGSSRVFVVRRIATAFAAKYAAIFPNDPLPALSDLPAAGKPGDVAYEALPASQKDLVTRAFVNVGKAIAAYERTLRVKPNRLDAYLAGDRSALTTLEKEGLSMFAQAGCMQCHWGPRLTDDAFHNVRLPGLTNGFVDRGRLDGIPAFLNAEFRADSKYSDARDTHAFLATSAAPSEFASHKTPSLRGVADLTHFGHAGAVDDVRTVLDIYGTAGAEADDSRALGVSEPWMLEFGFVMRWGIPPILNTLTADVAP